MRKNFKIAFVIRLLYPDMSGAALQTVHMASAFAEATSDAQLFVHDCLVSESQLFANYGLENTQLRLRSMKSRHWPSFTYNNSVLRFIIFNSLVALILTLYPDWRQSDGSSRKILFIRSRMEATFWGLIRPYLWYLRNWIFIYEMHNLEVGGSSSDPNRRLNSSRAKRTRRILRNFDLVLAVTQGLADDINTFTEGDIKPVVVRLSSGLARLPGPPCIRISSTRIVLGYVGSIDNLHGVDFLLEALKQLPDTFVLRIVGEIKGEFRNELNTFLRDARFANRLEIIPPVSYTEVAAEIDRSDILLVPAGSNLHSSRYRSPLKLYDYMARGKPILAADVSAHRELLTDDVNAWLYEQGNLQDLVDKLRGLAENPERAQAIANQAWMDSGQYTYLARAAHILKLADAYVMRHR